MTGKNDETLLWLECFDELGGVNMDDLKAFHQKATEILKVMSSSKKKLGQEIRNEK